MWITPLLLKVKIFCCLHNITRKSGQTRLNYIRYHYVPYRYLFKKRAPRFCNNAFHPSKDVALVPAFVN